MGDFMNEDYLIIDKGRFYEVSTTDEEESILVSKEEVKEYDDPENVAKLKGILELKRQDAKSTSQKRAQNRIKDEEFDEFLKRKIETGGESLEVIIQEIVDLNYHDIKKMFSY